MGPGIDNLITPAMLSVRRGFRTITDDNGSPSVSSRDKTHPFLHRFPLAAKKRKHAVGTISYTSDNILNIQPVKGHGASGSVRIKVPGSVSNAPFFTLALNFVSKDITKVTAKYAGQTDMIIRSDTQINNQDPFTFASNVSKYIDVYFSGDKNFERPILLNKITFYGSSIPNI